MINSVKTRAFANIALVKYWGKQTVGINCPATPSLSLVIDSLATETVIRRAERDSLILDGASILPSSPAHVFDIMHEWRRLGLLDGHFAIVTQNGFPSGAGLASSASGVAALTLGLGRMAESPPDNDFLNRLTRHGSGSAARSLTGGLSILPNGADPIATQIMAPEMVPWCIVTAVTDTRAKKIGSREAMEICRLTSPYYDAWLHRAQEDFRAMLDAVEKADFTRIGEITERNCLAMHACMWASRPPLVYWNGVTLDIIHAVRAWRCEGLETYFTIDAGPQVCILTERHHARTVANRLTAIAGINNILIGFPAKGAEVIKCE